MANKKRHIACEADLLSAMRSTGYCFPTNAIEQQMSLKLKSDIDIQALSKLIDPDDIWNSEQPRSYKKAGTEKHLTSETEYTPLWGMAAKGSSNVSKDIIDKIKKNQEKGLNGND